MGVVIAGAGARGAYEIGALSVLVPWLRERGEAPRVLVGTSAGAMNAVLVAGLAHAPDPYEAADEALAVWREISRSSVFRSLVVTSPFLVARYLADVAGIAKAPVTSLLDPEPLRRTLEKLGRWDDLHSNVSEGVLDAVAVITTACGRARTEVFVETAAGVTVPAPDDERRVTYVQTPLNPDHVMASASIPAAFPPVRIDDEDGEGDWYLDGGVRLNAPVKPALQLGAERLLVVATHPLAATTDVPLDGTRAPDLFSAVAKVLTSSLVDRMVEDVRGLDRVNRLLAAGAQTDRYRSVPYLFVGPSHAGAISAIAEEVLRTRYDGPAALLSPDFAILNRLVGGASDAHGELLSYLLFDHDFIEALIAQGRSDAQAAITAVGDRPWRLTMEDAAEPAPKPSTASTGRRPSRSAVARKSLARKASAAKPTPS